MAPMKSARALLLALAASALAPASALAQYSLEALPTAVAAEPRFEVGSAIARGISGNGQVIFGGTNTIQDERAIVWRRENNVWTRSFLPMINGLDGRPAGRAQSASFDGSTIVGWTGKVIPNTTTSNPGVPAIWRTTGGSTTLDTPFSTTSGQRGVATGVSANGQSIALWTRSTTDTNEGSRLARIDGGSGGTLTYLSAAGPLSTNNVLAATLPASSNMSSDGSTIVGHRTIGALDSGFTHTVAGGFQDLPSRSASIPYTRVSAVSGDGRVVGGTFSNQIVVNSIGPGALWRDGVLQSITAAPGLFINSGLDIAGFSSNGFYAVGVGGNNGVDLINNFNNPAALGSQVTAILMEGNHARSLREVLTSNGVSMPANTFLHYANGISADGRTITGVGTRQIGTTNQREFFSFVATIPTPGAATSIGLGMLLLAARRRQ